MKLQPPLLLFGLIGGNICFIILASVGSSAGPAAWLAFVGSILGSAITIGGAYLVFHLQTDATDERHLTTIRALLRELSAAGQSMAVPESELDPAKHVREALIAFATASTVAAEMRASGPRIARVAERLRVAPEAAHLERMREANGGVAPADLHARGGELKSLADDLLATLKGGL